MAGAGPRRIFVADHQPLVARGLVAVLSEEPDLEAFAGSSDPRLLVSEALEWQSEMAIIGLPADSSAQLEAAGRLRRSRPGIRLIVLAEADAGFDASQLVRAGITGVLARTATLAEVLATVRHGLAGKSLIAGEIATRLLDELTVAVRRADVRALPGGLTSRELEVLQLVADGLHNRDVAQQLHISENTVKNHMRSVHEKLGVRTRTEAVVTAAREGLLGLR